MFKRRRSEDKPARPQLTVEDLLELVEDALSHEDVQWAERILREAERSAPDHPDVVLELGYVLLWLEHPQAEAYVRRGTTLAAGDPGQLLRAAHQLFHIGDMPATAAVLHEIEAIADETYGGYPALMHLYGRVAIATGSEDEAAIERNLEFAVRLEPENAWFAHGLGEFLMKRGHKDRALEVVEEALQHNPDEQTLLDLRAAIRRWAGWVSEPEDESERREPKDESEGEVFDPDGQPLGVLLHVAEQAVAAADAVAAESMLRHAERRFPDHPGVVLGLGQALLMLEHPEAETYVRRGAELAEGDPARLVRAATQLFAIGDLAATGEILDRVWDHMPPKTEQEQERLLEYCGTFLHVSGKLGVAIGYDEENDTPEKMFEAAFDVEPENAHFARSLAEFHLRKGNNGRALEVLARALEHNPDDQALLDLRAGVRRPVGWRTTPTRRASGVRYFDSSDSA